MAAAKRLSDDMSVLLNSGGDGTFGAQTRYAERSGPSHETTA